MANNPVEVDPSQVHSIEVDPSQVQTGSPKGFMDQLGDSISHFASGVNPVNLAKGARDLVNGAITDVFPSAGPALGVNPNRQSTVKALGLDSSETQKKIIDSVKSGDYVTAARHLFGLLPGVGPQVDAMGDEAQKGNLGAALGDAAAFGVVNALPGSPAARVVARKVLNVRLPAASSATQAAKDAVQFGQEQGIPVSAATATGNKFVAGVQSVTDHSPLGSIVSQRANAAEGAAFRRVGGEIADQVYPTAVDPLQAGEGATQAVKAKISDYHRTASAEYDALREIESDPANLQTVKTGLDEDGKPVYKDIPLPVDMRPVKAALRPIYERLQRSMPVAEQRASGGLRAIENILNEEDYKPASIAESDLGAIKELARGADMPELRNISQGLAAKAVKEFDGAIRSAVRNAQRTVKPGETGVSANEPALNEASPSEPAPEVQPVSSTPGASPQVTGSADTTIRVPGQARGYKARYEVRELGDVEGSHNGQTFQRNPNYPLANDRDYTNVENQGKVVNWSSPSEFDPSYHITDNPDATNGPIVIDSNGTALGGNGRAMILQRVYSSNPKGAAAYRGMLEQKAPQFGIDPESIAGMKQPVLVRVIDDAELGGTPSKQSAISDFNKKPTAELRPSERAIADSRRVSQGTLDDLAGRLEAKGPDATLAEALDGRSGVDVLDKLINDGVVSPQERAALAEGDTLTKAGRDRISGLTLGRFFDNPAALDRVPLSVRGKLERIAAPLAKVEGDNSWSLTPQIKQALDLLDKAKAHGAANLSDYIRQSGLFGDQMYSPEAVTLARHLQQTGPAKLTDLVRQYASDAHYADGSSLFGDAPTPESAFKDAFGGEISEREPAAPAQAATEAPPAPRVVTSPAGADALGALTRGRAATVAKYQAKDVLAGIPKKGAEPRMVFDQAVWSKDAGINQLRALAKQAPDELPKIGRAYLEDVLGTQTVEGLKKGAGMFSKWENLGPETKKLLFSNPMLVKDLDNFFLLAKKSAESPNPSGTALVGSMIAGVGYVVKDPLRGIPLMIGAWALSKLLHSPAGVRALTTGLTVPAGRGAASAIAAMRILKLAGPDVRPLPQQSYPQAASSNDPSQQIGPLASVMPAR